MKGRCPKGYSRYTKSKKNIYFDKCCKTGLEPSKEVCLTDKQEEELNKKLNDEKIDKEILEEKAKAEKESAKAAAKAAKESAKAAAKAEKESAKAAAKVSKESPKSEVAVKESAAATTVNNHLITKQEKELNNPLLTTDEREFIIRHYELEDEANDIEERAKKRKKAAKKQKDYDAMHYVDKIRWSEEMELIKKRQRLEYDKNTYLASRRQARESASIIIAATKAVEASKYDAVIMPPPPLLKRALSSNVADQMAGDCFAHSSTRVFLRMISREFFEKHEKDDPLHVIQENACDNLYLIKEPFSVFSEKNDIERLCRNPGNYNSILMYFFLHKITIDKFNCEGGMPDYVLFYLLRIFNDLKNGRIELNQICNLGDPKYCDHLQPLINSFNQIETKYTASTMFYTQEMLARKKTQGQLIDHQNKFFDKIKEIIDLGLYVSLNINANIIQPISVSNGKMTVFSGYDHAVTIVDYDYSNPSNKTLKIKNSWGKPEHGKDIYIYLNKSKLDISPDQVRINYLEPTNEYSLSDLAVFDESISDKLPEYRTDALVEYDSEDESEDTYINLFRKWSMLAITFNSTNTINSFFDKYENMSIEMGDVLHKVLALSTGAGTFNKIVSEDILKNVFYCIIFNLKKHKIFDCIAYDSWLGMIGQNKKRENIAHAELNEEFETQLIDFKSGFPETSCSGSDEDMFFEKPELNEEFETQLIDFKSGFPETSCSGSDEDMFFEKKSIEQGEHGKQGKGKNKTGKKKHKYSKKKHKSDINENKYSKKKHKYSKKKHKSDINENKYSKKKHKYSKKK